MSASSSLLKTCFKSLVAIDGQCGESSPTSGIYLRKLGVSRSEIESYLTSEYRTAEDIYNDCYDSALQDIVAGVNNHFSPRYKAMSVLENQRIGIFQNNLEQIAGSVGMLKGVQFRMNNRESFLDLYVPQVSIQVNFSGEITFYLYDLIQGIQISSFKIPVEPNEIRTEAVALTVPSDRKYLNAFLGYECEGISSNRTLSAPGASCCGKWELNNRYLTVRPALMAIADQKIDANIKPAQETGGVSILYSLSCNHRDWICTIANRLALPLAYCTAAKIMEHAIFSASKVQINIRTGSQMSKEDLEERRLMYESKYQKFMTEALNASNIPSDASCFTCRQTSRTAVYIP